MVTNVMTTSQIFFSVRYVWTIFIISYFLFGSGYSREQKIQKKNRFSTLLIRHQVHLQPQH